jgi:tetratricopeptide (TPR) repeat protein
LSILTCALLEGVGIETAFVTVPGHIYIAFALNMKPDDARAFFSRPDDLILRNNRVWVPVEVTAVQEGFLRAWQLGAREWREGATAGNAGFWPTHEAWKLYEPVALVGGSTQFEPPSSDKLLARFQAAMSAFVDRELQSREQKLKADISAAKKDPRPGNSLGVLYARYSLYDKAEAAFRDSLKSAPNKAAWYNLGNILLLKNDFKSALNAFQISNGLAPGDPRVLAGLVRACYELDDRDGATRWFAQLEKTDSAMAEKLAYVNSGASSTSARAGEAGAAVLPWEE